MHTASIINDVDSLLAKGLFWGALECVNANAPNIANAAQRQPLLERGLLASNRLKSLRDAALFISQLQDCNTSSKRAQLEIAAYYTSIGQGTRAITVLRRALNEFGSSRVFLAELGLAYSDQGDNKKALTLFEKTFANARKTKQLTDPDVRAIARLAELRPLDKREITFLVTHFEANQNNLLRRDIAYTLAQAFQLSCAIEDEISWLRRANHAAYQIEEQSALSWTPALAQTRSTKIIDLFSEPTPPWLAVQGNPQAVIFLMGMPRSGTTLLDQVISSHSQVGSTGESRGFSVEMTKSLVQAQITPSDPNSPTAAIESLPLLPLAGLDKLTHNYLEYQRLFTDKPFIVDKNLSLVDYVGILANLLPNAKFVYLKRDVGDNCVSLLQQNLRNAAFATVPSWALIENKIYQEKMAHWQALFPDRVHTTHYEALASEGAEYTRSLIGSLGLEWESNMLLSASRKNVIKTPSATKVRGAINASQVGKKKKYADLLGPALKEIETYI